MARVLKDWQLANVRSDDSNLENLMRQPELYPNTRWVDGYKLGGGSFGIATLWVLIDTVTLKAIAHAVIKDGFENTYISTAVEGIYTGIYRQLVNKGLDFGADPTHEASQAVLRLRFLKEAYLQGLMTVRDVGEEIYAVPLYGYARKLLPTPHSCVHNRWRLYLPLYDYGNLQCVIAAHTVKQQAIPEPFIWHTFMCLMKAAVQLKEQARLRPHGINSDVIVVFDMKPANILLAPPNRESTCPSTQGRMLPILEEAVLQTKKILKTFQVEGPSLIRKASWLRRCQMPNGSAFYVVHVRTCGRLVECSS
jgi:hypothetical protein